MTTSPLFEVQNLTKRFRVGGWLRPAFFPALVDVSFRVERDEIVALVGESGSGKSTIARLCVRLDNPSSGRILLHGRDVLQDEPHQASLAYRKDVQMVFQDPFGSLNPTRTVGQHLERPVILHQARQSPDEIRTRVQALLETVGLSPGVEFVTKYPGELSGGQRQRVAIARALAPEPQILFADEPVSMLDLSIRAGILNLMLDLKTSRGVSFVYITHDLASARYIADRTLVLYAGHVVESGPSEDVLRSPLHPYTQRLIAAVPEIDKASVTTHGLPPSTATNQVEAGSGCPFASGCPQVMDACRRTKPALVHVDARHLVRCHLVTNSPNNTAVERGREEQ